MSNPTTKPVIITGGGDHASVVIDSLLRRNMRIAGFLDPSKSSQDEVFDVPCLGDDQAIENFTPGDVVLANGIASSSQIRMHRDIFNKFKNQSFDFTEIIHPETSISKRVKHEEGFQAMAGAVIQPGCEIGNNVLINTGAQLDHFCKIGDHTHIAPGAILSGNVTIGSEVHVGAGATIIQSVHVGDKAVIAAGAIVVDDVPPNSKVMGVPAREREN